jgi:RIO-like serine/threonine protein kinase
MSNAPYPPYAPVLKKVPIVGGFDRTCVVIELCTNGPLSPARIAQIEDQIELVLDKFNDIYKSDVIGPHRFTTQLKTALQL